MKTITKEFELAIAPTEDEEHSIIKKHTDKLFVQTKNKEFSGAKQHLHLISNDEVKKGEWCLHRVQHEYNLTTAWADNPMECYKIIATTYEFIIKGAHSNYSRDLGVIGVDGKIPDSIVKKFVESNGEMDRLEIEMWYGGSRCNGCGHPEDNHPYRHPFVGKLIPKLSVNGSILEDTKQKIYHIMDFQSKEILISSTDEKKLEKIFVKMEGPYDFIWSYDGEMIRRKVSK